MVTYGFPWAEKDISDDLGAGGGNSETNSSVLWLVITSSVSVDILEDFIESELSESLKTVSYEGW